MIDLIDLGLAYRKAKVDLYYSSHASLEAIANYESALHTNLKALLSKLKSNDESWVEKSDFLGGWTLATKSIDMSDCEQLRTKHGNGFIFSSPDEEWSQACKLSSKTKKPQKPKAQFRLIAQCSLDFHVMSTLWIMKVGHLFDRRLTACAYGNRLRRTQDGKEINQYSIGTFQPYLKPFRDWRDQGIEAMHTALNADKEIIALTADVRSFYHELNPSFMLNPKFELDVMEINLSDDEKKLHRLFIKALQAWAANTPLKRGLPVGLPASAVVANVALAELDQVIEQELLPLYYGRYVDDILLVLENKSEFQSSSELWEWIFSRSRGKLGWKKTSKANEVIFKPEYLGDSNILFSNSKNKIFILAGESGKNLVNAIYHQIAERASEWRAMPRLPRSASYVGTDLLTATQNDGEIADNLRKADALTMRRASFAIKLRDFEAYERDLRPESWQTHRLAFFRAFIQHVLVLPKFFDFSIYLPRVIRLAAACEDFEALKKILLALENIYKQVMEDCVLEIKACSSDALPPKIELLSRWRNQIGQSILESITSAMPPQLSKNGKISWEKNLANWHEKWVAGREQGEFSLKGYHSRQAKLFSFDLAHMPFRFIGLPKEMTAQRGIPARKTVLPCAHATDLLPLALVKGIQVLAHWINVAELPYGILFPTRPYNLPELFILNGSASNGDMQAVVLSVRGFKLTKEGVPSFNKNGIMEISSNPSKHQYSIAVASWKTEMDSWTASVMRLPDPDTERYARLCRLIDSVIAQPQHSRYLVLPELALPAHWFIRIAGKLQRRRISLIAGIEYLHTARSRVRNQVWAALLHDGLGFPSLMIYRQDKQRPALHEEQELHRLAGLEMRPDKKWKTPPIIQHGDIRFALLVCSELTNIGHRAALRGRVDALFVLEWNQDTETFNSLVESAALDIHAYIIQCNDREYGDSRIRAPFKDNWRRDIIRVKGGMTDYCVIGEIDIKTLRNFQTSHRSANKPFKPTPDGFEIDFSRRSLPK